MDFLDRDILSYSEKHSSNSSALLEKIERETYTQVLRPRMLSGHVQGRILAMFSQMIKPKHILEIGTYTGYSAICLAEGLHAEGSLVTIDINEELEKRVKGYFEESGYSQNIDFQLGNALELIPKMTQRWDLVFIDADKENYLNYYNLVLPQMEQGGIIIADNVLWSGKVVEEVDDNDMDTQALLAFNDQVHHDERVENVLLPVRDGLMILRVK